MEFLFFFTPFFFSKTPYNFLVYSNFQTSYCCLWCKGTNFQANHNIVLLVITSVITVAYGVKVLISKQITTLSALPFRAYHCCLWCKGTNFQANHNNNLNQLSLWETVAYGVKVLISKQITTSRTESFSLVYCCLWCKGTNFQANHNLL